MWLGAPLLNKLLDAVDVRFIQAARDRDLEPIVARRLQVPLDLRIAARSPDLVVERLRAVDGDVKLHILPVGELDRPVGHHAVRPKILLPLLDELLAQQRLAAHPRAIEVGLLRLHALDAIEPGVYRELGIGWLFMGKVIAVRAPKVALRRDVDRAERALGQRRHHERQPRQNRPPPEGMFGPCGCAVGHRVYSYTLLYAWGKLIYTAVSWSIKKALPADEGWQGP